MDSKRIVTTGVSRGLGLALAEAFAAMGHTVVGCARSAAAIKSLSGRFPKPHRFDAVDVSDDKAVGDWARSVIADGGPPDLLINNAALINRNAVTWEITADEFREIVAVNILGVANVIRHLVPAMIEHDRGVIVNFSSEWGRSVSPEVAPYCATKWAIEGLTQALAAELPRGLAAVPVNPGVIDTDMLRSTFGGAAGAYPKPAAWAKRAAPYLLSLSRRDNGKPRSVPV